MASMLEQIALYDMSKKEKTSVDYETWAAMSDDLTDSNKVIVPKNKNIEDPTDDGGGTSTIPIYKEYTIVDNTNQCMLFLIGKNFLIIDNGE